MSTLDVKGVGVMLFTVDTEITLPDGSTFQSGTTRPWGVPPNVGELTVDNTNDVICELKRTRQTATVNVGVFCPGTVRTPV